MIQISYKGIDTMDLAVDKRSLYLFIFYIDDWGEGSEQKKFVEDLNIKRTYRRIQFIKLFVATPEIVSTICIMQIIVYLTITFHSYYFDGCGNLATCGTKNNNHLCVGCTMFRKDWIMSTCILQFKSCELSCCDHTNLCSSLSAHDNLEQYSHTF